MKLRDLMNKNVISIDAEATVKEAAGVMAQHEIGSLVVMEQGKPAGIVTERDLLSRVVALGRNVEATKVKMIMSKPLICEGPDMEAIEAARFMVSKNIKKLPITQDGRLIGIMTLTDLCAVQPDLSRIAEEETKGKIPKRFLKRLAKRQYGT
jgi:CBS domain-containing protein